MSEIRRSARFLLTAAMILSATAAHSSGGSGDADHTRIQDEVVPISGSAGVTDAVVGSGDWHDPAIWNNGVVPAAGARALIPGGFSVTFSGDATLDWVRLEGTLEFDAKADSTLRLNTLVIDMDGLLKIGTPSRPALGKVLIEFRDAAPTDWTQLGQGLLSLGNVSIWGLEKSPFVQAARNPRVGESSVMLATIPKGWHVGDSIIFPGVAPPKRLGAKERANPDPDPLFREQHELRTITAINGKFVSFNRPLAYDLHWQLPAEGKLVVANLTRNIVLQSANPSSTPQRGHVMLMNGPNQIGHCLLKDLGRTATESHVTDPRKDESGKPIPETIENIRGRYSLHFHKLGPHIKNRVEGVVCWGGKKWGVVNHGSYVDVLDGVAVDIQGSGFATENGVEHGSFQRCLSVFNRGAGAGGINLNRRAGFAGDDLAFRDRAKLAHIAPVGKDWGAWGYGFWLQGPLVKVEDCISYGAQRESFAWTMAPVGSDWEGLPAEFPLELVPEQYRGVLGRSNVGRPRSRVPIKEVPTHQRNNVAIGSENGLGVYFSQAEAVGGSSLKHCSALNTYLPLNIYSPNRGWLFEDCELMFHEALIAGQLPTAATTHYNGVQDITFRDIRVENYGTGINPPNRGTTIIEGPRTRLVCLRGIAVDDGDDGKEFVTIDLSPEQFGRIDQEIVNRTHNKARLRKGVPQYSIYLEGKAKDLFTPLNILVEWRGSRIYFPASARDYVLPDGRTSLEVFMAEGRGPHGVLAPADAVKVDGIYGIVAAPRSAIGGNANRNSQSSGRDRNTDASTSRL